MVSRKTLKKIDLENFRSESFSIRTSECRAPAKGKPAFQYRITRGKPRVQNGVSRGRCGLRKTEKYFRLIMKKIYLENFKPLYTNKKSPATAGLF